MEKICVLQADNRESLDYLLKTQYINKCFCNYLNYEYIFIKIDNNKYGNIHPATKKIHIINDFLLENKCDILVFLDSDAWIQNGYWLNIIINNLINDKNKHGCFSRDPYRKHNTFINSGSFIIKNNDFTKQMYKNIINNLYNNIRYHNNWPFDQYYISNYIFENKEQFIIFIPKVLNTPDGMVLRHNWGKNKKMYNDMNITIENINNNIFNNTNFDEKQYFDQQEYPNKH